MTASRNWRRDAMFISEDGYPCVDFTFRNQWVREYMPGGPKYDPDLNKFVQCIDDRLFLALSPDIEGQQPTWHVLRFHRKVDRQVASLVARYTTEAGNPQMQIDNRLTDFISEIDSQICGREEKLKRIAKQDERLQKQQEEAREAERARAREELFMTTIPELQKGKILYSGVTADIT